MCFDVDIFAFWKTFVVDILDFHKCFDVDLLGFAKIWLLFAHTFWQHCFAGPPSKTVLLSTKWTGASKRSRTCQSCSESKESISITTGSSSSRFLFTVGARIPNARKPNTFENRTFQSSDFEPFWQPFCSVFEWSGPFENRTFKMAALS